MLNQVMLVGRLVEKPEVKELENGKKGCIITIASPRAFKNENGEYDTDFIPCKLWERIATNAAEYCNKGDIVGVKGRLQSTGNKLEIMVEKLTFLSSSKAKDSE